MQVWVLEYFCSDNNSYCFSGLFAERDSAIDYVLEDVDDWRIMDETETSSEIWRGETYKPVHERSRLDQPDYIVTRQDVRP